MLIRRRQPRENMVLEYKLINMMKVNDTTWKSVQWNVTYHVLMSLT